MIYKPKGARIWMAKWKYNGQDIRRSTGESNEKAARRAAVTLQYAYLDKENEKERTAEKLGCDSSQVGCCAVIWSRGSFAMADLTNSETPYA